MVGITIGAHHFLHVFGFINIFLKGNEVLKKIVSMMMAFIMVFTLIPYNIAFAEEIETTEENNEEILSTEEPFEEVFAESVEQEIEELEEDGLPEGVVAQGTCGATEDDDLSWSISEDGVLTISGTGAIKDYTKETRPWAEYAQNITALVLEEGITRIGNYAFCQFYSVDGSELFIPDTVKEIGQSAFWDSSFYGELILPEGLEILESSSLNNNQFTRIVIPSTLKTIYGVVFYNHAPLQEFVVSEDNTEFCDIDGVLFTKDGKKLISYPDARLGEYIVPEGTETIGRYSFFNKKVSDVILPKSTKNIEDYAFIGSKNVTVLSQLDSLGTASFGAYNGNKIYVYFLNGAPLEINPLGENSSFEGNGSVNPGTITIYYSEHESWDLELDENGLWNGYTVTKYVPNDYVVEFDPEDYVASGYCGDEIGGKNLAWMIDANGVLTIKGKGPIRDYTYTYDENDIWGLTNAPWREYADIVTSLEIEEGITEIGNYAFRGMVNIEGTLDIPEGVTRIGRIVFRGCHKLSGELKLPSTLKTVDDSAFEQSGYFTGTLVIPEGTESIGRCAFRDMSITAVTIPASVTNIGRAPFIFNYYLENITVAEDNPNYCSVDGVLFNKDKTEIIQMPMARTGSYIVPDSVTKIGSGTFTAGNLDEIIVPATVKTVVGGNYNYKKAIDMIFKGAPEEIGDDCLLQGSIYFMGGAPKSVVAATEAGPSFGEDIAIYYVDDGSWELDENGLWNGYTLIPFESNGAVEFDPADYDDSGYCGADVGGLNVAWLLKDRVLTIRGKGPMKDYTESGNAEEVRITNAPWFKYAHEINEIIIEDGITRIGECAFERIDDGKYDIKRIEVPESVKEIGKKAFWGCCLGGKIIIKSDLDSLDTTAFIFSASDIYFLGDAPKNVVEGYTNGITLHYLSEANGWETDENGLWNGYAVKTMTFSEWWECIDKILNDDITILIPDYLKENGAVTGSYNESTGTVTVNVNSITAEQWRQVYDAGSLYIPVIGNVPEGSTVKGSTTNDGLGIMYFRQRNSAEGAFPNTNKGVNMSFAQQVSLDGGSVMMIPFTMGKMYKTLMIKDAEGNVTYECLCYEIIINDSTAVELENVKQVVNLVDKERIIPDAENELVTGSVMGNGIVRYVYKGGAATVDAQLEDIKNSVTTTTTVKAPEGYTFKRASGLYNRTEATDDGVLIIADYRGSGRDVTIEWTNEAGESVFEKLSTVIGANKIYADEEGFTPIPRSRMKVSDEDIAFLKENGINFDISGTSGEIIITFAEDVNIKNLLESKKFYYYYGVFDNRFEITPPEGAVYYKWSNSSAGNDKYFIEGNTFDPTYLERFIISQKAPQYSGGRILQSTVTDEKTVWSNSNTSYLKTFWWYDADGELISKEYIRVYEEVKSFAEENVSWLKAEGFEPAVIAENAVETGFLARNGINVSVTEPGKVNITFAEDFDIESFLRKYDYNLAGHFGAYLSVCVAKPEGTSQKLGVKIYQNTTGADSIIYDWGNAMVTPTSTVLHDEEYSCSARFMMASIGEDAVVWKGGCGNVFLFWWYDENGEVIKKEYVIIESENIKVNTEKEEFVEIEEGDYIASGYCGATYDGINNISWTLDSSGVLTIRGNGDMGSCIEGYSGAIYQPWSQYHEEITAIRLEGNITHIGTGAFAGCRNVTEVPVLPESLKSINQCIFLGVPVSGKIVIPANVNYMVTNAFADSNISEIEVAEENASFCAAENVVYNKDMTTIIMAAPMRTGDVYVPESVAEISLSAFWFCKNAFDIYFCGDAPEVFDTSINPDKNTIYYDVKNDGWELDSDGKWHGCTAKTWVVPVLATGVEIIAPEKVYVGYPVEIEAVLTPEDTTTEGVEWNVVNVEGEATITSDGVLTPVKGGTIIIEARAKDDNECTAAKEVLVTDLGDVAALLKVDSAVAAENGNVRTSVEISEGTNANSIQFAISYDKDKLTLIDATEGSAMKGYNPYINTDIPGIVIFGWDGEEGITFGGDLIDLTFAVAEGTKGTEIAVEIIPDSDEYNLVIARALEDMTDYFYLEPHIENGTISVIDGKLGDINFDNRINVIDANLVRRFVAQYVELDSIQQVLADVNGDGYVDVMDANFIRKVAVKIYSGFDVVLS